MLGRHGGDTGLGVPDWFQELLEDYFRWQLRRGRSPGSIRTWRSQLTSFGRLLRELGVGGIAELGREHLEIHQDRVRERTSNLNTQLVSATALRGWLRFLEMERPDTGIPVGLFWRVVVPKQAPHQPRPLERAEVAAVLAHYARPRRDVAYMRDRALFLTLLSSGARISEVLQLRVEHVYGGPIYVRQKGGREKRLVLSQTAREWVLQYLRVRGYPQQPALWIRLDRIGKGGPLKGGDGVNLIWERVRSVLGLRHFTSHQLRHTAGTELLEAGYSDTEIADLLGHANTNMVRRYARVRDERRQEMADELDATFGLTRQSAEVPLVRFRRRRRRRRERGV